MLVHQPCQQLDDFWIQRVLVLQDVFVDERDVVAVFRGCGGQCVHVAINFGTNHFASLFRKEGRQATPAGANFKDDVFLREISGSNCKFDQINVDQEILTKVRAWVEAKLLEQLHEVRSSLATGVFHCMRFMASQSYKCCCRHHRSAASQRIFPGYPVRC